MITQYLTELYEAGLEYSTINGARSAISALHQHIENAPIGQHKLVKRVLAGIFNERPPVPRYTNTWDVNQVLTYIQNLGENCNLTDKILTHKLAMLLALTTACRASEIQGLDLRYMIDKGTSIAFTICKLTKTRKTGEKPQSVVLNTYEADATLDIVKCVRAYVSRTANWRSESQHQLLVGITKPHNPVCTSTISNWLKKLMDAAGIDTLSFKGHSTRSAATSKADSTGLSVADIIKQANWKNATTFRKFYHKTPASSERFANAVLCM